MKEKTTKFPKLESLITSKGLSYDDVANVIGMKKRAFERRMIGEVEFMLDEIVELCGLFECELSDIIEYKK